MHLFLLFESASGYALFEREEFDEIAGELPQIQSAITSMERFSKLVKMKAYAPFTSAEMALSNILAVAKGEVSEDLKTFLETFLPAVKKAKKQKFKLGISDSRLGQSISENTSFTASMSETISELLRGIRLHFTHFSKKLKPEDLRKAQLGLAHSYSRSIC